MGREIKKNNSKISSTFSLQDRKTMAVPLISDSKRMYLEQIELATMEEYFRDILEDITGSQLSKVGDIKSED